MLIGLTGSGLGCRLRGLNSFRRQRRQYVNGLVLSGFSWVPYLQYVLVSMSTFLADHTPMDCLSVQPQCSLSYWPLMGCLDRLLEVLHGG